MDVREVSDVRETKATGATKRDGGMKRRVWRSAMAGAAVLVLLGGSASADLIQLKDGRVMDGVKMERKDEFIVLHFENGDVEVPMAMVEDYAIEGEPPPAATTDEEKAKREAGLVPPPTSTKHSPRPE